MCFGLSKVKNSKGQALVILVLVMVIALTVGLSIATRTIVNLRNTSEQTGSQKALSAAEAGIEEAIKKIKTSASTTFVGSASWLSESGGNESKYEYSTQEAGGGAGKILLNGGSEIEPMDSIYVWVVPYKDDFSRTWSGNLTVYWGDASTNCNSGNTGNPTPALEVAVIYADAANPDKYHARLKRYALDPCDTSASPTGRRKENGFTAASTENNTACLTNKCVNLQYKYNLDLTAYKVLLVRINPVYSATKIGVEGNPALPDQGIVITSTGSDQGTVRTVNAFEGYPEIPAEFFPFTLFKH